MSKLTERVSYLKGLAEGMKLAAESDESKLLLEMVGILEDTAAAIQELTDAHNDLYDFVSNVDDDLADLEESLFGEDEEEDEEEEEASLPQVIHYDCPHCGETVEFPAEDVNFTEDVACPHCGKPLFPEAKS